MTVTNKIVSITTAMATSLVAQNAEAKILPPPRPMPMPSIVIVGQQTNEAPIKIENTEKVIENNGFFSRVRTTFTFTNPNGRVMTGELEFPIPDEAFVCGYSLEINGEMVPGVVCEKEKARVAFENEMRKGVDPGIVEQVKGNIWRTRIFPLNPNTPRKAEVDYIVQNETITIKELIERNGDDFFKAVITDDEAKQISIAEKISLFTKGTILWDASLSAKEKAKAWHEKLASLPEKGEWKLIVFRHVRETEQIFTDKADLLKALEAIVYDGGTSLNAALSGIDEDALLFSDEISTMDLQIVKYENLENLIIASRDDKPKRKIEVSKIDAVKVDPPPQESTLLASVWASRRMQDLASQADSRKDEFLSLGRKYGVAGPGLSLIVLENLRQWLDNKIEPPESLSIHKEWVETRAAEDDLIAEKKLKADHEQRLLTYWEERVKWWNDPKPKKQTPKSGLFDTVGSRDQINQNDVMPDPVSAPVERTMFSINEEVLFENNAVDFSITGARRYARAVKSASSTVKPPEPTASVTLKAWDPKTPYIDALKAAPKGEAYNVYLKEREKYSASPAFYLDCAGWFFKAGETKLAERIITNLSEFKLEDAALWRTMGWRLREAGSYKLTIDVFSKVFNMRNEEGISYRDLAIVNAEYGKKLYSEGNYKLAKDTLEEALVLFRDAAFKVHTRRSMRRGNDFQVAIIALEELNGLISWIEAQKWTDGMKPVIPELDEVYRRDLPVKIRIVMSWDADQTDIDLHVLEPNGEEAYYGHRRTSEGGFVSEDVTTGYGPEEYLRKDAESGIYKVLSNYFASHQTALTGATTVTATVYTDWGKANEKMQIMSLRLDKPKDKYFIGEIKIAEQAQ